MPKFKVEWVDAAGKGFTDIIEASTEEEVTATLKESGYMVTKIALHKDRKATKKKGKYKRIKKTTKTTFKRTDLTANKTCYYKVRAYYKNSDGSKSYSKYSSIVEGSLVASRFFRTRVCRS